MNRRDALACGLGAAGLAASSLTPGSAPGAQRTEDRSASAPSSPVAIQRCESFERQAVRRAFEAAFDLIGGIGKLVRNKTVTIKVNLTGKSWKPCCGLPAYESYQTHPNTVAALCAILNNAGAKRMIVVESLYWDRPLEETLADSGWDIPMIQSASGHRVSYEDTRNRGSFDSYSRFPVPWGGFVYPSFDLNQRYEKTDVLISLAKLKQHACAGVTGAVKNFFGITPCSIYGNDAPGEDALDHRTEMFHAGRKSVPEGVPAELDHDVPSKAVYRVPRITADIFGARPADLNIVEGIVTIRGGEGFWNRGVSLMKPRVLLAGRNGVCTDSVCTAVMGFDPQAAHDTFPFQGDNHLRLLASVGVGTNDVNKIELLGLPLKQAVHPFEPRRGE